MSPKSTSKMNPYLPFTFDKMSEVNYILVMLVLFVVFFSSVATAAYINTTPSGGAGKQVPTTVGEPNFHNILEQVGKTTLRPGGSQATQKLQKWANLTTESRVLELSSGLGKSGIMLAETYGCKVLLTDKDNNRLEKASHTVKLKGLDNLITIQNLDMFELDRSASALGFREQPFDCAMMEASLTHFPTEKKQQLMKSIASHANQYLLHEVCIKKEDPQIAQTVKRDMEKVLNIGFYPETLTSWRSILENAGFVVDNVEVGDLQVLNSSSILKDEGFLGMLHIVKKIVSQPYLRSRVIATREAIGSHKKDLGYVIMRATKQ